MPNRILTWYIENPLQDGSSEGMQYLLDRSYILPGKVIIRTGVAPDGDDLQIDIKDDDVSVFSTLPTIPKGQSEDEDWDDFDDSLTQMAQFSWVTLEIPQSGGAKRISVTLELNYEQTEEVEDELD